MKSWAMIPLIVGLAMVTVCVSGWCAEVRTSNLQLFLGGLDPRVKLDWLDQGNLPPGGMKPDPGDYGRKIQHAGMGRFYEVHVPPAYRPDRLMPVVLVFHGGGGYPAAVRYQSSMDSKADQAGFIVVYPAGTNKRILQDRLLVWNDGREYQDGGGKSEVDDVGFVAALLDDLTTLFSIDAQRIYAAGISNGAQFAYYLVDKLPNRIAAVAAVAGQRVATSCRARPIPIMQFSGLADVIAPYRGGSPRFETTFKTVLPPVEEAIQSWVLCNQCASAPVSERKVGQAKEVRYGGCKEGAEVILWTLGGGGHTWPGGRTLPAEAEWGVGAVSFDINATDEMWAFFSRHSL